MPAHHPETHRPAKLPQQARLTRRRSLLAWAAGAAGAAIGAGGGLAGCASPVAPAGPAASSALPNLALSPQAAEQDLRVLRRALRELHPALTKYLRPEQLDAAMARFEARAAAAREVGELWLAATELAAALRCGHTWTNPRNQQGLARAALFERADKLPLQVRWVGQRVLVLASTDPAVQAGDELLALDGLPMAEVARQIWPCLRADGQSDGKRWRQLDHQRGDPSQLDLVWPLLRPPQAGGHRVRWAPAAGGAPREAALAAWRLADRDDALQARGWPAPDERWRFQIDGELALMTLPTFSFYGGRNPFDWAGFLERHFALLEARQVPNLVIDLRANEGGDGTIGAQLMRHLIQAPLHYTSDQSASRYERVPYVLARYLDTWDFSFFDRTGQVDPITDGPQAGLYNVRARAKGLRTLLPVARPYAGRVFMLVGGENSSASFHLAWLAQRSGRVTLVGQPTGGNLRGLNGGELAWVTLPNSGVAVDIPLLATRYEADTPDAPVQPEVLVTRHFEAQAAGQDEELAAVRRLLGPG